MENPGREVDSVLIGSAGEERRRWQVPVEVPLVLTVNERRWVTLMCTPVARRHLALGFAYFAGLFQELAEVLTLCECLDDPNQIQMRLATDAPELSRNPVITSGCGQGVSPAQLWPDEPVPPATPLSPTQVSDLMRQLQEGSIIHNTVGGTHASALCEGGKIVALYEDIGRHNTLDKLMGHALLTGMVTSGMTLVTSGRISSEMLYKAVRMRLSAVISRTSPTDLAVDLALRYGLTLIGYARGRQFTAFCGPGVPATSSNSERDVSPLKL